MKRKDTVFNEILKYIPHEKFEEIVKEHQGDKWSKKIKYWDLFLVLLHGQLSGETSLRMVGLSHNARYDAARKVPRSTLSDSCKTKRPEILMKVFWELVEKLGHQSKKPLKELSSAIQLLDATSIMLTERGHEWVKENGRIKGLKMHTLYDYDLKSPIYFSITDANINDIEEAKKLSLGAGKIYVFDKGYCDFTWWNQINEKGNCFVTRLKKGICYKVKRRDKPTTEDIKCDQAIVLTARSGKNYKSELRRIRVKLDNKKSIILVTNDLKSTAGRIAELYKERWKIELFFKCIKQNLKIKRFWGKSENAVRLQIIVAMVACVLLRLIQMKSLSFYSLKEIGVIIRVNISSSLMISKVLKIPVSINSTGFKNGKRYD